MSGRNGNEIGRINEDRFVRIVNNSNIECIFYAKRATSEQDNHGIDAVIVTEFGEMFFQIKTSFGEKRKFCRKQLKGKYDSVIECVVVNNNYSDKDITLNIKKIILGKCNKNDWF